MSARLKKPRRVWPFTNLTLLAASIIFTILLTRNPQFQYFLSHLNGWGYLGAFIAGALFVVSFTAPLGIVVLFSLAQIYSPLEIGLLAGAGGVLGDLFIFHLFKNHLQDELGIIYRFFGGNHLSKVLQTPYFSWTLPVIGALIIATPLPDEIGVSLLGLSKMSTSTFAGISFFINALSLTILLTLSQLVS